MVSVSFACICVSKTVEQKFCNSDYVIQAKVKFRNYFTDNTIYGVQIYRKFKWGGKLENNWGENWINGNRSIWGNNLENEDFEIWTAKEIEDCGQHLSLDEIYVISFDFDRDGVRAITSFCHLGEKFSNFDTEEKVFFLTGFKKINCDQIQRFRDQIQNISNEVENPEEPLETHGNNLKIESKESTNFATDHDYNKVTQHNQTKQNYVNNELNGSTVSYPSNEQMTQNLLTEMKKSVHFEEDYEFYVTTNPQTLYQTEKSFTQNMEEKKLVKELKRFEKYLMSLLKNKYVTKNYFND